MRVVLVHAPLRSTISELALGYQTPLGLLMIAGPLIDHGHEVHLLDAALPPAPPSLVAGADHTRPCPAAALPLCLFARGPRVLPGGP